MKLIATRLNAPSPEPLLVEIVNYRRRVGSHPLMALREEMESKGLSDGAFISFAGFTPDAIEYAAINGITLYTPDDLVKPGQDGSDFLGGSHNIYERIFQGGVDEKAALELFQRKRRKPFLGILGSDERVDAVDGRFTPIGVFRLGRPGLGGVESSNLFYINLNTCLIYYVYRGVGGKDVRLRSSNVIRRMLELDLGAVRFLSSVVSQGEVLYERLDPAGAASLAENTQALSALGRLGLVTFRPDGRGCYSAVNLPPFSDARYGLSAFLAEGGPIESGFGADEIAYAPDMLLNILRAFFQARGEFAGVIYLRYFRCRYSSSDGGIRFDYFEDYQRKNG